VIFRAKEHTFARLTVLSITQRCNCYFAVTHACSILASLMHSTIENCYSPSVYFLHDATKYNIPNSLRLNAGDETRPSVTTR